MTVLFHDHRAVGSLGRLVSFMRFGGGYLWLLSNHCFLTAELVTDHVQVHLFVECQRHCSKKDRRYKPFPLNGS
jgi:hypothetical protein